MKEYTAAYKQIMTPEVRVGRNQILPRNIYRISTYIGGEPATKIGKDTRYVFVIGKLDNKVHCLLLNNIEPENFLAFLNKLRNKSKIIEKQQPLSELLKLMPRDGEQLFNGYVKSNKKIYNTRLDNYRTYFIDKIQNVWEIRFEEGFLQEVFGEKPTPAKIKAEIKEEINENDG